MANPQPNRHFLVIHRDLLCALAAIKCGRTALKVALALVRCSYGFREATTMDKAHIGALADITGISSHAQVRRALRELEDLGVIEVVFLSEGGGKRPSEYRIVKDWESWAGMPSGWLPPWHEKGPNGPRTPESPLPRTPESPVEPDPGLQSPPSPDSGVPPTPDSRVPHEKRVREEKEKRKSSSGSRAHTREQRGPNGLKMNVGWETVGGAEDDGPDLETRAREIIRSLSPQQSGRFYHPPQQQVLAVVEALQANSADLIDAAVQKSGTMGQPLRFFLSLLRGGPEIELRDYAEKTAAAKPNQRGIVPAFGCIFMPNEHHAEKTPHLTNWRPVTEDDWAECVATMAEAGHTLPAEFVIEEAEGLILTRAHTVDVCDQRLFREVLGRQHEVQSEMNRRRQEREKSEREAAARAAHEAAEAERLRKRALARDAIHAAYVKALLAGEVPVGAHMVWHDFGATDEEILAEAGHTPDDCAEPTTTIEAIRATAIGPRTYPGEAA